MRKREIFIICIFSLLVCIVAINFYSSNNLARIKTIIEENIDAYGTGKIVKITPHPKISNYFILQISTDWWDSVYGIYIENGTIDKSDLIVNGECKTIANFIFLEGFNDYFIEFYYSTHMGNGGYILYDPKSDYSITDIYGVFDCNLESYNYLELVESFGYNEYSFVFKDDFLNVKHADFNGDGYSDLEFTGEQNILDQDGNIVHSSKCKIIYVYNPKNKTFIIDKGKCEFSEFWQYNWNSID